MREQDQAESSLRPTRLRVGVVGAGRVGAPFGAALERAGHQIVGVSAISEASRRRAELLLPHTPVRPADEVVKEADLVLFTIPDDVLPAVVEGAAKSGLFHEGQIVVHTAGRFGVTVLDSARSAGASPLAIHPVMTFTGTAVDIERMKGAVFGITADAQSMPIAEALVLEVGGEPAKIAESDRVAYHAALAWSANFLTVLIAEGLDQLRMIGVEEPARALAPLLSAALDNVLRSGDRALTGPIARGDAATVAAHLRVIKERNPEVLDAYFVLACLTADRAAAAKLLRPADLVAIKRLLGSDDAPR